MIEQIIILILVTLLPFFELRASIPLGILANTVHLPFGYTVSGFGLPWPLVLAVCVITNAILGPIIYLFLDKAMHYFLQHKIISKQFDRLLHRAQRKIKPYVEKYGDFGIALFIAVPLPGSGSYSGALAAYFLGLKHRKFIVANAIGVLIAGIAVTTLVLTGQTLFG
jgi:uncharacterized membrane protein